MFAGPLGEGLRGGRNLGGGGIDLLGAAVQTLGHPVEAPGDGTNEQGHKHDNGQQASTDGDGGQEQAAAPCLAGRQQALALGVGQGLFGVAEERHTGNHIYLPVSVAFHAALLCHTGLENLQLTR